MTGTATDALTILKEYGLAGVMAWLFWWTLRRTMASHDATVHQLKEQLDTQAQATRAAGQSFAEVVQNHMTHVCDALARFDANLSHQAEEQRRWQARLLDIMDRVASYLSAERKT